MIRRHLTRTEHSLMFLSDLDGERSNDSDTSEEVIPKEREVVADESSDEYETITELLEINPYIYKPVQRLVRRPHLNRRPTHSTCTITSANAGELSWFPVENLENVKIPWNLKPDLEKHGKPLDKPI